MGLFDSIKDAASSIGDKISSGVSDAKDAIGSIAKKVEDAPAAISKGAGQALRGAVQLGKDFVKDPKGTIKHAASQAVEGAKTIGRKVVDGAKAAGEWSWKHKGEIGFWVGTTALLMAVPVSGGASGALAGGMMAARGAAVAARVASMGKAGATAVKVAKSGAHAVQAARGAMGGTKAAAAASKTNSAIHSGRVALGGTKVGKGMIAAQKPLLKVSTGLATVNLADTSWKYAHGDASKKDLALATLGFAPNVASAVGKVSARRATLASEKAAGKIADDVQVLTGKAADATDDVAHVATVAPKVDAPVTAGVAAEAREQAAVTVDKAVDLRAQVQVTARAGEAQDAISATTIARKLDDIAENARLAKVKAADAEELAPDGGLTSAASAARERLEEAEETASRARRAINRLARKQQRADALADGAEKLEGAIGTTSLHVNNVNNGIKSYTEQHAQGGLSLTDGSLAKGIVAWMMARNASRATAGAFTPVPPPTATSAASAVTSRAEAARAA